MAYRGLGVASPWATRTCDALCPTARLEYTASVVGYTDPHKDKLAERWTVSTSNVVFFGCNYNDKKIKAQFDSLKKRIEADTALSCIVIDKRNGRPARDLWKDIQSYIEDSAACVFDLTGFRPNVVLELGYALSIKSEDQVFITFRKRKAKGTAPKWLLSDISHLQRHEYISIPDLEDYVREQLGLIPFSKGHTEFLAACDGTGAPEKYLQRGLKVLQSLRDNGPRSKQQLQSLLAGSACRFEKMQSMLKSAKLIKRSQGRHGKFTIYKSAE
jgi:hypothetical protein